MRDALEALLDAAGEARAREILSEIARPAALAEFERIAALRLALRMREARTPRHVMRDRLELRGLSRATAYRVICRAIDVPMADCLSDGAAVRRDPDIVPEPADLAADQQQQENTLNIDPSPADQATAALRVEVTALRAPWPAGVVIGSIVEFPGDKLPDSFAGKCKLAAMGAEATHRYEPPRPQVAEPVEPVDLADVLGSAGNVEFLTARRDELRARRAAIDLPAARKELARTRAAMLGAPGDVAPVSPPGAGEMPEQAERRQTHERAAQAFKVAQGRVPQLEAEERELLSELGYIESLLTAEKQVEMAKAAASDVDAELASRSHAAAAADAALQRIVDLIAEEERSYAKERDAAGARVLEAIKSGGASVPVKAASRDKIATLEVAKSGAEQEQRAARAAQQQAASRRREAWQRVRVAEAAIAERVFRQAERDFIEALTRVMVAKSVAREQFGTPDPRGEAIERSRRVVDSLGI